MLGSDVVYEVLLTGRAERDLRHLPDTVHERVASVLKRLCSNPRPQGCTKMVGATSDWRIRVEDYRVIYEIEDKTRTVRIMFIRHRREAYR